MSCSLIHWFYPVLLLLSSSVIAGETPVERQARLYGFGSSDDITTPCEMDNQHTMRAYIDRSVAEALRKNPVLFDDESLINRRKIPKDIVVFDKQGVYVNDRPTQTYFLPQADEAFEGVGISCANSACRWMVKTICTVRGLSGEEFLVYWGRRGILVYVLKRDFVLLENIK